MQNGESDAVAGDEFESGFGGAAEVGGVEHDFCVSVLVEELDELLSADEATLEALDQKGGHVIARLGLLHFSLNVEKRRLTSR